MTKLNHFQIGCIITIIFLSFFEFFLFFSPSNAYAILAEDRPVWLRLYSWEKSNPGSTISSYDSYWWGPNSGVPETVIVDGYSRTNSRANAWATGTDVQWGLWSGHACARGVPTYVNMSPDGKQYINSPDCLEFNQNGGAKVWCRPDNLTQAANGGGDGCETYWWFGDEWKPNNNEDNAQCVTSGSGRYDHFLCNFRAIIDFVNPRTDIPDLSFKRRYTYNAYVHTPSNLPVVAHFKAPTSYYLYDMKVIYHTRHGGVSFNDQTSGFPAYSINSDGYEGQVTFTSESRGTLVLGRARKEINGRVLGIDGTASPAGIPNITIRIQARDANTGSTVIGTTTTDSNGYYRFRGNFDLYQYYTVDVTSPAPAGYVGSAYAISWQNPNAPMGSGIPYTWRSIASGGVTIRDTIVGDPYYAYQATYWPNDCTSEVNSGVPAGRCNFGFLKDTTPPTTPSVDITASPRCVMTVGNQIRWTASTDTSGISNYLIYIYYPSGACSVGAGNNISCTSSYYIGSVPHNPVGGYIYFNNFNFQQSGGFGNYYILVQAVDNAGNKGAPGSAFLETIGNVSVSVPMLSETLVPYTGYNLSWLPASGATGYRLYRNGSLLYNSANRTYTDNYCNGSASYYVQAYNFCSATNSETDTVSCIPNTAPTCTLQYFNNSTGSFSNFSGSVQLNRGETRSIKAVCTDINNDPLSFYFWSATCGSLGSGSITINGDNSFTAPNVNGASCQVSVRTYDGYLYSNWRSGTFTTLPPNNGTISLFTDTLPFTKSRISTSNNSFRVANYEGVSNAIATIQTSGVCASGVGSCVFASTGTNTISVPPNASGTSIFNFNINLLNNPFAYNYGWNLPVTVLFSAGNQSRTNVMSMTDTLPACTSISFNPVSPSASSIINITQSIYDDWSLKGYGVTAYNTAGTAYSIVPLSDSLAPRTVNAANALTNDVRTINYSWNTSTLPQDNYRLVTTVRDTQNQTFACDNNYIVGYNSMFRIDRTAPTCELVSFPNATSPSIVSPIQVSSRANDTYSNLTGVQIIVVPAGANKAVVGNRVYDSGLIPLSVAPSTSYTYTTALASSWVTNNLPRGLYDVYVDWFDSAGNITNTLPTNQCRQTFELGSQYRAEVEIVSDDADGYGRARSEGITGLFGFGIFKSGAWNTAPFSGWQVNDINKNNCNAAYPNGVVNDDHDNNPGAGACDDYFLTPQVFSVSESTNIGILIPKSNGVPKYKCDAISLNGVNQTIQAGVYPLNANYDYCAISGGFVPQQGGALPPTGAIDTAYPTVAQFKLSYNVDGVSGIIYSKAGNSISGYMINKTNPATGLNGSYFNIIGNTYFRVPGGSDPRDAWQDVAGATANFNFTNFDSADIDCYYLYDNNPTYPNSPHGYLPTPSNDSTEMIDRINNNPSAITKAPNCVFTGLDLNHGRFSPWYQNQISIQVTPHLKISRSATPENKIQLATNADNCDPVTGTAVDLPYAAEISLRQGATTLESYSIGAGDNGEFEFTTTLDYNTTYSVCVDSINNIGNISNFGFCSEGLPGASNCFSFTPNLSTNANTDFEDNNGFLVNFPNVPTPAPISIPIRMYLKESNNWWQVYNGGVHTNSKLIVNSNEIGGSEGMPSGAVIIGDPRNIPPGNDIPVGFDIYNQLGLPNPVYVGGLVSSYDFEPVGFDDFGINQAGDDRNWNVTNFVTGTDKPLQFELSTLALVQNVYNFVNNDDSNGWVSDSSIASTLRNNKRYYTASSDVSFDNGGATLDSISTSPLVVSVIDLSGGSSNIAASDNTFTIDTDIDLGVSEALIIYVNGNVKISKDVNVLDSVFIVATGNIIIESAGEDLDTQTLLIRGGLYGRYVEFNRDLEDTIDPLNPNASIRPATSILFDNSIISKSHMGSADYPSEAKESKIYWLVKQ